MKKIFIVLITVIVSLPLFAQDYKFGKVSKAELSEKFNPQDSSAFATFIYRDRKTYFKYEKGQGFQVITEVFERLKIYNKEGYDWASKNIYFYDSHQGSEKITGLKANTFNLNDDKIVVNKLGKKNIFEEKKNKYWSQKKFTLPNLKEGCVVEWKYKLVSPFRRIADLQFQFSIPVKKMTAKISIPEYFQFKKTQKGYYFVQATKDRKNEKVIMTDKVKSRGAGMYRVVQNSYSTSELNYVNEIDLYKIHNIPALYEEDYVSNIDNYKTAILYEYAAVKWPNEPIKFFSQSWSDVTKSIYKSSSFGQELSKTNFFKDDIELIVATISNKKEMIVPIFEFVKTKIKNNNVDGVYTYNGVKEAYKNGVGNVADINLCLVSMLREAGLKANPVILSTRKNGIPYLPTLNGFNYVIAAVELDDGIVLLDASSKYTSPNTLSNNARNWKGRIVREDGSSDWVNLDSYKKPETKSNLNIEINNDGSISGMNRTVYTGVSALVYRNKFAEIKDESIIEKIEQEKGDIEIDNFKITNKRNQYKNLIEMYKFYSEESVESIGDKVYFNPLFFYSATSNPFNLEKRDYPVDFGSSFTIKNTISIKIPEGYQVESLPDNLAIGLSKNNGTYKFLIKETGNSIQVSTSFDINSKIISSEDYLELKNFYSQVVNKNKEQIVLTKSQL